MRPEGLEAKNNSSLQASQLSGLHFDFALFDLVFKPLKSYRNLCFFFTSRPHPAMICK
jgi:hypothetical protein